MNRNPPHIALLLLIAFMLPGTVTSALSEETASHSIYMFTSHNLGPLLLNNSDSTAAEIGDVPLLMITGNNSDLLTHEVQQFISDDTLLDIAPGSQGIAISASFDATEKIGLTGAFGMTRNLNSPDKSDRQAKASWEANIGIIYHIINNLSYELHFGYMDTGDLFTEQSSYNDVESIIMVNNKLTLSF